MDRESSASGCGIYVPAGKDRLKEELKIWGLVSLQVKISTEDSKGALFVFEHPNLKKGGPPRHVHPVQDEWFYPIKGEFAVEIGGEHFRLKPGDSLFAPRNVPHTWAAVGDGPNTILLAIQPAGSMEAFFREGAKLKEPPAPEEVARWFAAHGMEVLGPPLREFE